MKRIVIAAALLLSVSVVLGTTSRIQTMGGATAMLPDDDRNINLFPQRINDWGIVRYEGIQTNEPDYLLIVGKKGQKWGFYGGTQQEDDFFNIIKSTSPTGAIELGVRFSTTKLSTTDSNKEPPPAHNVTEATNEYTDISIYGTYGFDMGSAEVAISGGYMSGPGEINFLSGAVDLPHGKVDYTHKSNFDTSGYSGESKFSGMGFYLDYRAPQNFFIFDMMYFNAGYTSGKLTHEFTQDTTLTEDGEGSLTALEANILFFKNQKITSKALLAYGIGFGFGSVKEEDINMVSDPSTGKLTNEDKDTFSGMLFGGPRFRAGLEVELLKWAKVRFGITRTINLYESSEDVDLDPLGGGSDTEPDEFKEEESGIGKSGNYIFASGVGLNFGNLQIDVVLNSQFWVTGPQMIFGNYPPLGIRADVIYQFNVPKTK